MSTLDISCPACHKMLSLAQEVPDRWLTCPNCLAQVMNPSQAIQTTPPQPAAAPTSGCPRCGEAVEARWAYCPYCNQQLQPSRGRPATGAQSEIDTERQKDTRRSATTFIVLAVLLGLGFFACAISGGLGNVAGNVIVALILLAVPVLFIVGMTVAIGTSKSTAAKIGASIALILTLPVVLVAALILLFAITCAMDQRRAAPPAAGKKIVPPAGKAVVPPKF